MEMGFVFCGPYYLICHLDYSRYSTVDLVHSKEIWKVNENPLRQMLATIRRTERIYRFEKETKSKI